MTSGDEPSVSFHIPGDYLEEIGRIVVEWTGLEGLLSLCLMKLSGMDIHDPRSLIVFNHLTFPVKMNILSSLVHELQSRYPGLRSFPETRKKLEKAQQGRNRVVHGTWLVDESSGQVQMARATARGTLKTSVENIDLNEVRQISADIQAAWQALWTTVIKSNLPDTRDGS